MPPIKDSIICSLYLIGRHLYLLKAVRKKYQAYQFLTAELSISEFNIAYVFFFFFNDAFVQSLSYEKKFDRHANEPVAELIFTWWFRTRNRFETETKGNSEMAYSSQLWTIWYKSFLVSPVWNICWTYSWPDSASDAGCFWHPPDWIKAYANIYNRPLGYKYYLNKAIRKRI